MPNKKTKDNLLAEKVSAEKKVGAVHPSASASGQS